MNYQEYRNKWDQAVKGITPKIPLNLDIELSSVCNLKCPMCPQGAMSAENKRFMDIQLFKDIIDQAADIGIPAIKLNWRGEPTLHPVFFEKVLPYTQDKFLDVRINTNGQYKTYNNASLAEFCKTIIFSVDSLKHYTSQILRPGIDLDLLKQNIVSLAYFINNYHKKENKKIIINYTIQKENESECDCIKKFCDDLKIGFNPRLLFPRTEKDKEFVVNKRKIIGRKNCGYPFQRLLVDWQGKIHFCCVDWDDKGVIGDFGKESLLDVWNALLINQVRFGVKNYGLHQNLCKNHCTSWAGYKFKKG